MFYRRQKPVRRAAEVIAAEKEAKAASAKTCQICNRPIFAETGVIAHHGYQRPCEGWQTASCAGARHLPYEASCVELGKELVFAKERLDDLLFTEAKVQAEALPMPWTDGDGRLPLDRKGRPTNKTWDVTRENYAECVADWIAAADRYGRRSAYYAPTYEKLKERRLAQLAQRISMMRSYIKTQQARYDAWKPTHNFEEGAWVKI